MGNTIASDLIIMTISTNPLLTMDRVVTITSVSFLMYEGKPGFKTLRGIARKEANDDALREGNLPRCPGSTGQDVQITV